MSLRTTDRKALKLALKYRKPNPQLHLELKSVSLDAQRVIEAIEAQNFLPDDFPAITLIDICTTLFDLPNGTAEGCRTPLEYARGRIPAIRRNHFFVEEENDLHTDIDSEPQLLRGMSLDRCLKDLISSIATALDEYRFQASEQHDEATDLLLETSVPRSPDIAEVISGAESVELSMRSASSELNEIAEPQSENADALARALKDTEGLARVSKAELNFGSVVVRWYKNIAFAAKKMPKVIIAAAKGVKVGTDIAKSFSGRWIEMCENFMDFGLKELDKWADTTIEVSTKLQKRIDEYGDPQNGEKSQENGEEKDPVFDSASLYKEGFVSYIEKRGLYAFLLDVEGTRYFLPLERGHLRSGQLVELGCVARFRYAENKRGKTAIEVLIHENAVFSITYGTLHLDRARFNFEDFIKKIAEQNSKQNRISLYKLDSQISAEFKSTKKMHETLGYDSLASLIKSIPGLSLSGVEPNLWVEMQNVIDIKQKLPVSMPNLRDWLEQVLSEKKYGEGMLLSEMGQRARARFDADGRIPNALGYPTYVKLIENIETLKVATTPAGAQYVTLASSPKKYNSEKKAVVVEIKTKKKIALKDFEAWLRELLNLPKHSQGILFSQLGIEAHKVFEVEGKIPTSLGFQNYAQVIDQLEGLSTSGQAPKQRVIVGSRKFDDTDQKP